MKAAGALTFRLDDLVTFLAVRRAGTVSGAARSLDVTASQVSKAIARLERHLDAPLLARGTRGVSLTDAGQRVVPEVQEIVDRMLRLGNDEALHQPLLTVAAPSWLCLCFVGRIATGLADLRIRGVDLAPALVRVHAAGGFFDVALTMKRERLPSPWVSTEIGSIRRALYATPSVARTIGKQPVSAEALRHVPFVSPAYNIDGHSVPVDDGCPLGLRRRFGHEVPTIGLGLEVAAQTGQLVYGPSIAALDHVARGRLVEIRVRGWDARDTLFVAVNSDRVLARVHTAIVAILTNALGELSGSRRGSRKPGRSRRQLAPIEP